MSISSDSQIPENALSETIAKMLVLDMWQLCGAKKLRSYLTDVFDMVLPEPPVIAKVFVSQAEGGDYERGQLYSMGAWWAIDANGFCASHIPLSAERPDDPRNSFNGYYFTPYLRFFAADRDIVIGQTFGPSLLIRKKAQLVVYEQRVGLANARICWRSDIK